MSFSAYLLSEVKVSFHQDFEVDFDAVNETVQDELLAHAKLLEQFGPQRGLWRLSFRRQHMRFKFSAIMLVILLGGTMVAQEQPAPAKEGHTSGWNTWCF